MAERHVNHIRPKASSGLSAMEVGNAELSAVGDNSSNVRFEPEADCLMEQLHCDKIIRLIVFTN